MKNIKEAVELCLEETPIEDFNALAGFRELEVVL
jgi:hypothetical protein